MEAYFELCSGNEGKTFTGIEGTKNGIVKYFQVSKYINYIKFCYNWFSLWGNGYDLIDRFLYNIHKPKDLTIGFNRNPNLSCRYIFVALHYQPECTTSPMGGAYVHQDLMLNILIKSIPDDIKIYIKPHPRKGLSRTLQNRMYIDSRVEIISPVYNSYDLIIKSLAVATVTGTTGWEAFINKIPVLMFGEYFYQDAPGVFSVKTLSDVVFAISNILDEKFVISERMVRAFLKALDEKTFPGWVDNRYADLSDIEVQQNAINIAANLSNAIKRQS